MFEQMTGPVNPLNQLAGMQNTRVPKAPTTLEGYLTGIASLAHQISLEIGHLEQIYYQISGESTPGDIEVGGPEPGEPSLIDQARSANRELDSDLDRLRAVKDALQTRIFNTA